MSKAPSERHLEDWIVSNWNSFGEYNEKFQMFIPYQTRLLGRQIVLPSGRIDLISADGEDDYPESLTVIELKKGNVTYDSIGQCARYLYEIGEILKNIQLRGGGYLSRYLSPFDSQEFTRVGVQHSPISGLLVGRGMQDHHIPMAAAQSNISVVLYDHDGYGYIFEGQGDNKKFKEDYNPENIRSKDLTQYLESMVDFDHNQKQHKEYQDRLWRQIQSRSAN